MTKPRFSQRLLPGRASRYAARATVVVLLGLIALLGWNTRNYLRPEKISQASLAAQASNPRISAEAIANMHVFGAPAPTAASPAQASSPATWHIIGIVAGSAPDESMADIAIDGVEHIWHVGDRLPDGSTLITISDNGITTNRGGSGALMPFELRPIGYDDHFDTLPVDSDDAKPGNTIATAPSARPVDPGTVADRLTALRAAGVAEWVKRTQASQSPPPPPPPNHD